MPRSVAVTATDASAFRRFARAHGGSSFGSCTRLFSSSYSTGERAAEFRPALVAESRRQFGRLGRGPGSGRTSLSCVEPSPRGPQCGSAASGIMLRPKEVQTRSPASPYGSSSPVAGSRTCSMKWSVRSGARESADGVARGGRESGLPALGHDLSDRYSGVSAARPGDR